MENKSLFKVLLLGGALGIIIGIVHDALQEKAKINIVNNDDCSDNQTDQPNQTKDWNNFENALTELLNDYQQKYTRNHSLQNTVKQLKEQITKLKTKNESK